MPAFVLCLVATETIVLVRREEDGFERSSVGVATATRGGVMCTYEGEALGYDGVVKQSVGPGKRRMALLAFEREILVNVVGCLVDEYIVAGEAVGVEGGIRTNLVIEVARLTGDVTVSPSKRESGLGMNEVSVHLLEGFHVVAGIASFDEPALVHIDVAQATGITIKLGLVEAKVEVATAAGSSRVCACEGIPGFGIMIESEVGPHGAPGLRGMAVLARHRDVAMGTQRLGVLRHQWCIRYNQKGGEYPERINRYPHASIHRVVCKQYVLSH